MDYYQILELDSSATQDDIKKSYRRLAREHHPDRNAQDPQAAERFKQLATAYEVLSDPTRRANYDRFGADGVGGIGGPGGGTVFDVGGLGDILGSMFGGSDIFGAQRGPIGPPPGENLEVYLPLDFEEAVFGAQKEISVETMVPCDECEATGAEKGTMPTGCAHCSGTGQIREVRQSFMGQMVTQSACRHCRGMGEIIENPCMSCHGRGRQQESRSYSVRIQPGMESGQTLKLSDRGAVGERGGPAGDLYIHLNVQPHETLKRNGFDLVDEIEIPMTLAALGAELKYQTLDGEETLAIAPGTQSGHVIRLRNKGVPRRRGRGDLLVQVKVAVPVNLTSEQREQLQKLAELRGEDVSQPEASLFRRLRSRS